MNNTKEKPLIDIVLEMKKELQEIHASLSVYIIVKHSRETITEINNLQDRLEYRILKYEEQLLKEKINIYKQALKLAKNDSKNIKIISK
ncbi:MAG TPA: hypothetical protein ENI76_07470 [Ignavibacteria bacterium]|nr:hypothetical protein [Ignavibacteria bacterium]